MQRRLVVRLCSRQSRKASRRLLGLAASTSNRCDHNLYMPTKRMLFFLSIFLNTMSEKRPLHKILSPPNASTSLSTRHGRSIRAFQPQIAHSKSQIANPDCDRNRRLARRSLLRSIRPAMNSASGEAIPSPTPKSSVPHPTANSAFSPCVTLARCTTSLRPLCNTPWTSCRSKRSANSNT